MILLVDDDASSLRLHRRILDDAGYASAASRSAEEALLELVEQDVEVVVTDLEMPGASGVDLLRTMRDGGHRQPVVVVSGHGTVGAALEAVRAGAHDFLEKPVHPDRFLLTLKNALGFAELQKSNEVLRGGGSDLIGEGPAMRTLKQLIARVAPTDGRVIILGENGTGKELVARQIHQLSSRARGPFVSLNCAAVPSELIESELFGHEKGAFTGAARARKGTFEQADGGTLFLDEVGDMPLAMQVKLLRVLQESRVTRVGGHEPLQVDVRVIAATHQDIVSMVDEGRFREDLYYRLNVVTLRVPALRDRLEDVPALTESFILALRQRLQRPELHVADEAKAALQRHAYPGNVRELQNLLERLAILSPTPEIGVKDVERELPFLRRGADAPADRLYRPNMSLRDRLEELEAQIIAEALEAHDGNKAATARALEVDRSHFFRKCRKLGI